MEIKKKLKSLDVKLSKMAIDLGVSRPTLDSYIESYEIGNPIPNEGYQKIFDYLFKDNQDMNTIEFAKRYDYIKRVMLNDATNGATVTKINEKEQKIKNDIIQMVENDSDSDILNFINLFLKNKNNDLVKYIYTYFDYANGFKDITENEIVELEKALYSHLHFTFKKFNSGELDAIDSEFNEVVQKNKDLFRKKKTKVSNADIIKYIKNNLRDDESIDLDLLTEMLESRGEEE